MSLPSSSRRAMRSRIPRTTATGHVYSRLQRPHRPDVRARVARRPIHVRRAHHRAPVPWHHRRRRQPDRRYRQPAGVGHQGFHHQFRHLSPQPVYITSMALESTYSNNGSTVIGTEQSYFELPSTTTGTNTRDNVAAPPTAVVIDFSSPLPYSSDGVAINYANDILLIGSANGAGQPSDGDFGNLGRRRSGQHRLRVLDRQRHHGHSLQLQSNDRDLGADRPRRVGHAAGADFRAHARRPTTTRSTSPTRLSRATSTPESSTSTATSSTAKTSATRPRRPALTSTIRTHRSAVPEYEDLQSNGTYRRTT